MSDVEPARFARYIKRILNAAGSALASMPYLKIGNGLTATVNREDNAIELAFDPESAMSTSWKLVEGRATSNISVNSPPSSIGGIAKTADFRYLLTAQSTGSQNGVYYYDSGQAKLVRASDADTEDELKGITVRVRAGDGAGEVWYLSNTGQCRPDVDSLTFALKEEATDKATLDALDAAADAAVLENASTAVSTLGVPILATPATIRIKGTSTVEPFASAYLRAAGAIGAGLITEREILSGNVDTNTGVRHAFRMRGYTTSTKRDIARWECKPSAVDSGNDNLTTQLSLSLLNNSTTPSQVFTFKANGDIIVTGKITGLIAGAATGEAVEYDQLNNALGDYVPLTRTLTTHDPIKIAGGHVADLSADLDITFEPEDDVTLGGFGLVDVGVIVHNIAFPAESVGHEFTMDLAEANHHEITLTANSTIIVDNITVGQGPIVLLVYEGGSGSYSLGFSADFAGSTGLGAALDTALGKCTAYTFRATNNGKLTCTSVYVTAT